MTPGKSIVAVSIIVHCLSTVPVQADGIANTIVQMLPMESAIWTATSEGIVKWNIANGTHRIYTTQDGLPDNYCSSIAQAPDGGIWAVIDNRHVAVFDGSGWDVISEDTPLNGDYIYKVLFDGNGDPWVRTNYGIYRKAGDDWYRFSEADGLAGWPSGIYPAPNGDIWLTHLTWCIDNCPTSGRGVSHFDGEKWEVFDTGNGLLDNRTVGVSFSDDGRVWVLSMAGFSVYDGQSWVSDDTFGFGYPDQCICLPDSTVFAAQPAGVYRLKNGKWSMYTRNDIGLLTEPVTLFADTNDRLWVGSWDGVSMFDGSEWTVIGMDSTWGGKYYHSITESGDTIWIASHNGLFSWDGTRSVIYRTEGITGILDYETEPLPLQAVLHPNSPNPFNPTTRIPFSLSDGGMVTIRIYDITGRLMTELFSGYLPAGEHQLRWNAGECASGVYFCRLTAGDTILTRNMTLLR